MTTTFHEASFIHTAVPLIRSSEDDAWPSAGDSLFIRVSQKAYFDGKPACQLKGATEALTPQYWFLGICAQVPSTAKTVVSVGTTIKFVSVAISGVVYNNKSIIFLNPADITPTVLSL